MEKHKRAEIFQKDLKVAFRRAMVAASLHKSTACAGMATLTWATVVLMGGFASQVPIPDFMHVTCLVLNIACLLALALFTSKLVTKKSIYTGPLDPVQLSYNDKRLRHIRYYQLISCLLQLVVIVPCLWIAIPSIFRSDFKGISVPRLLLTGNPGGAADANSTVSDLQTCVQISCPASPLSNITVMSMDSCAPSCIPAAAISNLQVCLYAFFVLVNMTCVLALMCLAYIALETYFWQMSLSLKKYHDEVLSRALSLGFVEADEFDAREFLLRCLGEDMVIRNIGALEVHKQNANSVEYLYNHPKGVEMVYEGLAAEDTVRQQTAANMVGFWAISRVEGLEKITALLSRLAEKLGLAGKTAEAAANSFSALAVAWKGKIPSPLLKLQVPACDGGGMCNVVERVVDLVLTRRTPTLQVYIRVLDSFFMSAEVGTWLATERTNKFKEMKAKLMSIIQGSERIRTRNIGEMATQMDSNIRARTRFLAFSALDRLSSIDLPAPRADAAGEAAYVNCPPQKGHEMCIMMALAIFAGLHQHIQAAPHHEHQLPPPTVHRDDAAYNFDWSTRAPRALLCLDSDLKNQEFMWCDEAKRYKELCIKFYGEQYSETRNSTEQLLGAWLNDCIIRGLDTAIVA